MTAVVRTRRLASPRMVGGGAACICVSIALAFAAGVANSVVAPWLFGLAAIVPVAWVVGGEPARAATNAHDVARAAHPPLRRYERLGSVENARPVRFPLGGAQGAAALYISPEVWLDPAWTATECAPTGHEPMSAFECATHDRGPTRAAIRAERAARAPAR